MTGNLLHLDNSKEEEAESSFQICPKYERKEMTEDKKAQKNRASLEDKWCTCGDAKTGRNQSLQLGRTKCKECNQCHIQSGRQGLYSLLSQ